MKRKIAATLSIVISLVFFSAFFIGTFAKVNVTYHVFNNEKIDMPYYFREQIEEISLSDKTGYSFVGWYYDEKFTKEVNFENEKAKFNKHYYAKWEEVKVVKVYDQSLSLITQFNIKPGEQLNNYYSFVEPIHSTYEERFLGWYSTPYPTGSKDKITLSMEVNENINIYACFKKIN